MSTGNQQPRFNTNGRSVAPGGNAPSEWLYPSSCSQGLSLTVSPRTSDLHVLSIYRLNLVSGSSTVVSYPDQEVNAVVMHGSVMVEHRGQRHELHRLDSFYQPAGEHTRVTANSDAWLFLGAAPCEGYGSFFVRRFDDNLPLGEIHQVHGAPPYQREVFMTVNQEVPASRLICGITMGDTGGWTSWPPHQHSVDLEEAYCYFDITPPNFALHLSSRTPGRVEAVHVVGNGDCVIIPEGYHPTVGAPGTKSSYFWAMAAHRHERRRYDLAVADFGV